LRGIDVYERGRALAGRVRWSSTGVIGIGPGTTGVLEKAVLVLLVVGCVALAREDLHGRGLAPDPVSAALSYRVR
jgi:hypothetical protein